METQDNIRKVRSKSIQTVALVMFILLSLAAGGVGGIATAKSVGTWYQTLEKPSFNPPDAVFGPVWTTLFVLMGISAWLVWRKHELFIIRLAMILFFVQLMLNTCWSILFFGLQRPDLAFFELLLLWIAIVFTTLFFWRHSSLAGILLLPYLCWVTFAGVLNFMIWRLNI